MSKPSNEITLKMLQDGYATSSVVAGHLMIHRITPWKWAQKPKKIKGQKQRPPRVRSKMHNGFLFVNLADCEKIVKGAR